MLVPKTISMLSLSPYQLVLASGSPRRKAFLEALKIPFIIDVRPVAEDFPKSLAGAAIAEHIVAQKLQPFKKDIHPHQIILAADTVVWHQGASLGKPKDLKEAAAMLRKLSGGMHEVITAFGFLLSSGTTLFHATTKVHFKPLSEESIAHYLQTDPPLDKAGAYGIQDWIGTVGIEKIEGSYTNVVGLPVSLVVEKLQEIVGN